MTQYLLILWLVSGSSNLVYELSGQYGLAQCQSLYAQRLAAARAANPGATFVGGCYPMVAV